MDAFLSLRLPGVLRYLAVAIVAANALAAGRLLADDAPPPCHPQLRSQDQLWLVSDRGLGCQVAQEVKKLEYWRYDREKSWVRSDLAGMQDAESENLLTTIFVHGNRISWCEAFTKGWNVYRTLVRCAQERPVRLIIWSWPSAAIKGPIEDARVKACRTNLSGYYLAWFVDQLDPQAPVSLWGHSFGARVVSGALHVLGGGEIAGHRLVERAHATRDPVQAVLLAAALDSDWLSPGRFHGLAVSQVDRMLLVNNSCDALLKRYHWIYHRRACQQALGYTGLFTARLGGDARSKIQQVDACCVVGRQHTLVNYLWATGLMAQIRKVLLFEPDAKRADEVETVAVADATPAP
jgi:hypothetical protein